MNIYVNSRFLTQNLTGVQRYAIELSKQLKKIYGDDIVFVCPNNVVNNEAFKLLGAKIIGHYTGHLWEQWDLPRFLKKNGAPLLINLSNTAPLIYGNKVTTIHDITFVRFPNTYSKAFVTLYRFMIPLVIKTSKHVFTVSEFSKEEISNYYHCDRSKMSVIYNAVSSDFQHRGDKELSLRKYFMAVSSVKESKNFLYILDAFTKFSRDYDDVELLIIGDLKSNSFKTLDIDIYIKNPRIKTLGRISDEALIKYYSNAYAFLFPSLYEGFGIPPLEAQACGCPVVCSEASCLPEVFGDSVLYCDPYNVDTMVSAMNQLMNDNSVIASLREKGRINVTRFSWEKSAMQMSRIIENILLSADNQVS